MSNDKQIIKEALAKIAKSKKIIGRAQRALVRVYEPQIQKAVEEKDLNAICALILDVPEVYVHKVRLYQAYLEIKKELGNE